MDGVKINKSDNCYKVRITKLTDDLKQLIREKLTNICYGSVRAKEDPNFYSYKSTLVNFFERYDDKFAKQKKGIIGELIAHVLLTNSFKQLNTASVFFNKEEKSMRKGFDIVVYDKTLNSMFYCEVKSGECCQNKKNCNYNRQKCDNKSNIKNKSLLAKAKSDIHNRLIDKSRIIWEGALIDINLTTPNKVRNKLQALLKTDYSQCEEQKDYKKSVILISVLYEEKGNASISSIKEFFESLKKENLFENSIILSIQKNTYKTIEDFLRQEMLGV
ncbi:hypothetical protein [Pseudobacteroides cellulosolvens]|uniref:Anti-bacteriophage protein A/HamA C-terminal domain-containing protein n=1 Tax=Pseudobacteroides cellulosolvens ATCC 35603 = DSM 2933 TaxID=398512 RepID=A0A0L6JXH4_9FIRM|nr:hypothetical protein [Pseudobacteroides cellulosolvens]KNY30556.1 hypothetical protein Bccel_5836 [Pseudobacteroides cellulosolvens ATCC 35603 = DSM 2933]